MWFSSNDNIWLYRSPVDFRKGIDGLVYLVVDQLKRDPASGHVFVFRNKLCSSLKLLWWNVNGFWLCYRRLEKGRFIFPRSGDSVWVLDQDDLNWLLSGLDFTKQKKRCKVRATNFI